MENIIFVAEFTTNHMGNLNLLLKMTEKAGELGCDYIKMQKKDVNTFYTPEKLSRPFKSPYGQTYGEYRNIFEFDKEDTKRFDTACNKADIKWFATVQDIPSLQFMQEFNPHMYKIASTNISNNALIHEMVASIPNDEKVIISTGGATLSEIEKTLTLLSSFKDIFILHCVAEYPCPDDHVRLGNIPELIRHFASENVKIGYSGHEVGYIPSLVAISLGAKMIERHFCLSRYSFVHHIECSLEPNEYAEMMQIVKDANDASDLAKYTQMLPLQAMESCFGMSTGEEDFLLKQQYGSKFIKDKSIWYEND